MVPRSWPQPGRCSGHRPGAGRPRGPAGAGGGAGPPPGLNAGSGPPSRRGWAGPGPSISRALCLRPGAALMRNKLRHILSVISSSVSKIYGTIMARTPPVEPGPPPSAAARRARRWGGCLGGAGEEPGPREMCRSPRGCSPSPQPPGGVPASEGPQRPAPVSYERGHASLLLCASKKPLFYPQGINKMSSTQLESVPVPTSARTGKAGPALPAAPGSRGARSARQK